MKKSSKRSEDSLLRQKAEALQKKRPPRSSSTSQHTEADARKLLHELEVHQIELEMQNDELMRARSAANELAEKYVALYDLSPSGYVTLSLTGEIQQLNFACARMLGKERSRLIHNRFRYLVSSESRPAFDLFIQNVAKGAGAVTCEAALSMNESDPVFVHLTGIVSTDQQSIFITATDITERKKSEAELRRLYEQTQRDAAIKTELLNEVNHRVKNNLMMILGLILAEEKRVAADHRHEMSAIWEKFEGRLNGLLYVHQMLSDSHWAPVNLSQLAERICASAIASGGDGEQPVDLRVGESDMTVSSRQASNLALVFNELTINCLKYAFSDKDDARIRITNKREGDRICIEFHDSGSGYPEHVLNHDGWNVGLRLMHQIVEGTLGGKVLLSNESGAMARIFLDADGKPPIEL